MRNDLEKNQLSLPAFQALKSLSNCFSDPIGAFSLLKSDMKTRISVIKLETHLEYMEHLIAARVGTEEAENCAMRLIFGGIDNWSKSEQRSKARSREVVEEVMRTMEMWVRKERKAVEGGQRMVVAHCQFTMEQLWRVGMREGTEKREEGTPEHFLNSVLTRYKGGGEGAGQAEGGQQGHLQGEGQVEGRKGEEGEPREGRGD